MSQSQPENQKEKEPRRGNPILNLFRPPIPEIKQRIWHPGQQVARPPLPPLRPPGGITPGFIPIPPYGLPQNLSLKLELTFTTEPIIAWRIWTVQPYMRRGGVTEDRLFSLNSYMWPPYEVCKSWCQMGNFHEAPWSGCSCGIWAFKDKKNAKSMAGQHNVYGQVALWGRVIEATMGYRAEKAYPQELYVPSRLPTSKRTAANLKKIYGCEVFLDDKRIDG